MKKITGIVKFLGLISISLVLASCASTPSAKVMAQREEIEKDMVLIPGTDYEMMKTEVTQGLYKRVTGGNPSVFQTGSKFYEKIYKKPFVMLEEGDESMLPVETVSWYDAIYFCNLLSVAVGYKPVYSIDGNTDVKKWGYIPHKSLNPGAKNIKWDENGNVEMYSCGPNFPVITADPSANGYRLPTSEEWIYAAKAGKDYKYAGSDNIDEVAWYSNDSKYPMTHIVAQKKPNDFGLYDMSGNVFEWLWDMNGNSNPKRGNYYRGYIGGCWNYIGDLCAFDSKYFLNFLVAEQPMLENRHIGIRLIRTVSESEIKDK